jgi:ABC-type phosphate transport system substrate-binding protein
MCNLIRSFVLVATCCAALPALADVVVVVNPGAPETSMSKEEIAQYFLGRSAALTPVDQPENAPIRAEFYRKVADKDMAQTKALWSKLVFTGKATMPREVTGNAEVKKAVAANPKAIGYIDRSAVDATVKVVYPAP